MQTETELILKSRRVVPGGLLEHGFTFRFPHWPEAAQDLCREWKEMRSDRARFPQPARNSLVPFLRPPRQRGGARGARRPLARAARAVLARRWAGVAPARRARARPPPARQQQLPHSFLAATRRHIQRRRPVLLVYRV